MTKKFFKTKNHLPRNLFAYCFERLRGRRRMDEEEMGRINIEK
jgi:hypothetical protein